MTNYLEKHIPFGSRFLRVLFLPLNLQKFMPIPRANITHVIISSGPIIDNIGDNFIKLDLFPKSILLALKIQSHLHNIFKSLSIGSITPHQFQKKKTLHNSILTFNPPLKHGLNNKPLGPLVCMFPVPKSLCFGDQERRVALQQTQYLAQGGLY